MKVATKPRDVDAYISDFSIEVQELLQQIRATIKKAAPEAKEKISYGMPAFEQHGVLVYFAAYENHIGFYATPTGHSEFKAELGRYKEGKGSVQFPLDQPVPFDLIERITVFRLNENLRKRQ